MALAWATGLLAIVALAFLGGRLADRPAPVPAAVAVTTPPVDATTVDPATLVQVRIPSGPGAVITTSHLMVGGTRTVDAGELLVTLRSPTGEAISTVTLAAAPGRGPFLVDFPLSDPRPEGRLIVQVVALPAGGSRVEVARVPVEIGPFQPIALGTIPDRRLPRLGPAVLGGAPREVGNGRLGDDGIVGGIVFGNAWDPEALVP